MDAIRNEHAVARLRALGSETPAPQTTTVEAYRECIAPVEYAVEQAVGHEITNAFC